MSRVSIAVGLILIAVCAVPLVAQNRGSAGPVTQQAALKTSTELDGVWIVQSAERNGQPLPLAVSNVTVWRGGVPVNSTEMRITFKGDNANFKGFFATPTGDEATYSYTLGTEAKPKALTLKLDSAVISTVYELTGDTLRLVLPRPGAERPSKVSSEVSALFVLKKMK